MDGQQGGVVTSVGSTADELARESHAAMASRDYRRDLGRGLVLRWTTADDVERVVELYAQVFRRTAESPPNVYLPVWTRDMFSGRHPHIGPGDFAIVEDTQSGKFVAATCLLRYTCQFEGIPFGFGRPEIVASLPEYRHQGLVRAVFELIHARSTQQGDLVQGITGINYYYRQFGYEYAAPLLDEGLTVYFPAIPALKSDASEPYVLREATLDDVALLQRLWERECARSAVWTTIGEDYWRWAMAGSHQDSLEHWRVYLIAEAAGNGEGQADGQADGQAMGRPVGALVLMPGRWSASMAVNLLLIDGGVPLAQVMPSVLRGVRALAEMTRPLRQETPPAGAISFRWSSPALRSALGDIPSVEPPYTYAWYLRVADLPRFLRHVAPVLERRLSESPQAGYTGELTVDFYRGGLRLVLENGRLAVIDDWQRPVWGEGKAGFPPLVFLQALFGYRSLHELRGIYPDVFAEGDAAPLLDALFPKRPTLLVPLD